MVDIATFVPGGIKPTDVWHHDHNDGTCSRCRALVSDHDVPLMLFSECGNDMLIYCWACLTPVPPAGSNVVSFKVPSHPSVCTETQGPRATLGGPAGSHSLSTGGPD